MSPIAQAVEPLRQDAMKASAEYAGRLIKSVIAKIEACGWDINAAYPYPNGPMGKADYRQAKVFYLLARCLTSTDETRHPLASLRRGEPHYVVVNQDGIDRYVEEARKDASAQYDLFIAKLEEKVGEHSAATLNGNHVWGHSILTVTTPAGVQRWKTQQIINTSSLGTVFNQWPTRLVK